MKTITIWALQLSVALAVLALGIAKVSGADIMVTLFDGLGFGPSLRLVIGAVEILAGLCLLVPQAAVVGAALLVCLSFGVMGITVAQLAHAQERPAATAASFVTPAIHPAIAGNATGHVRAMSVRPEWSI
jgi:hypothetical protein